MNLLTITTKQFSILNFLYQFRFLDRIQIQTLMGHKNHRRIHAWLNDLVQKRCVGRIYSNKMPDNTKPAVYYISTNGRKLLQKAQEGKDTAINNASEDPNSNINYSQKGLRAFYRDSSKTPLFRLQLLGLADCYIAIKKYMEGKDYRWAYYSRFECSEYEFLSELLPDSFVSATTENGLDKAYAIYFITHRLPKRMIRFKLRHMFNFFFNDNWYQEPHPKIYIICTSLAISNYSKKIIESKIEEYSFTDSVDCYFTTLSEFQSFGFDKRIWRKPKTEETD